MNDHEILEIRELSGAQVEEALGRGHGWARRHIVELGGYREGTRYHFPVHGIKAWQERQAAEFAKEARRPAS